MTFPKYWKHDFVFLLLQLIISWKNFINISLLVHVNRPSKHTSYSCVFKSAMLNLKWHFHLFHNMVLVLTTWSHQSHKIGRRYWAKGLQIVPHSGLVNVIYILLDRQSYTWIVHRNHLCTDMIHRSQVVRVLNIALLQKYISHKIYCNHELEPALPWNLSSRY